MLFPRDRYFAPGSILLVYEEYYDPEGYALFKMSGKKSDKNKPLDAQIWSKKDDGTETWTPSYRNVSLDSCLGLFTEENVERAKEIVLAANRMCRLQKDIKHASRESLISCIGNDLDVSDFARQADFMNAISMHLLGQHDGLTEPFVTETKAALDRLIVRTRLATPDVEMDF